MKIRVIPIKKERSSKQAPAKISRILKKVGGKKGLLMAKAIFGKPLSLRGKNHG